MTEIPTVLTRTVRSEYTYVDITFEGDNTGGDLIVESYAVHNGERLEEGFRFTGAGMGPGCVIEFAKFVKSVVGLDVVTPVAEMLWEVK